MHEAITALEQWLANNAPSLLELLRPPATPVMIAAFETRHALVLPPEARSLYLIHDGEGDDSDGIFGCWRWLPLKVVSEEIELIGSERIVPLFRSGGGDLYYVKSHDPAVPDRKLYEWWHEAPQEAEVMADSLAAFMAQFVAELRGGQYQGQRA